MNAKTQSQLNQSFTIAAYLLFGIRAAQSGDIAWALVMLVYSGLMFCLDGDDE